MGSNFLHIEDSLKSQRRSDVVAMKQRVYAVPDLHRYGGVGCADDAIHVTKAGFRARLGFVKHTFWFLLN